MSQIILAIQQQNFSELLELNLTTYLGSEVICRDNTQEILDLLRLLPEVEIVVTESSLKGDNSYSDIEQYIKNHQLETQLILFGPENLEMSDQTLLIDAPLAWRECVQLCSKILGITQETLEKKIRPNFVPISADYLLHIDRSICDIFIRIKQGPGDYQYVKRIHSGDHFSQADINKYMSQGLKNFFIPLEFEMNFANYISDQLVSQIEKMGDDKRGNIKLLSESFEVAIKEVYKNGLNAATIQLADSIIVGITQGLGETKQISGLLHLLVNSKTSPLYQHSHMILIMCLECIKNLDPDKVDKNKAQHILAYTSLFHDISLMDCPEFEKIHSYSELEILELEEDQWDKIMEHPKHSAEMLEKSSEHIAPEIIQTIKSHHGASNSKGFPLKPSDDLSIYAQIFIVAEKFVHLIDIYKDSSNSSGPQPVIQELYSFFPQQNFQEIIRSLEASLNRYAQSKK
jgi:response regulator RpfG family c-di-GMP phosphodiesterase